MKPGLTEVDGRVDRIFMLRVGLVGLGKMGLSHYAIVNALEGVGVVAVCDASAYLLSMLTKYSGIHTHVRIQDMLDEENLDAVVIATPSHLHESMVRACLGKGVAIFCEKPFALDGAASVQMANSARESGIVTQVGYHYRFVGAFQEMARLVKSGVVGRVSHVLAEAYGPVVLAPSGSSWRGDKSKGGGALYDYGAHPLNLLTWLFGVPSGVSGTSFRSVFSSATEDVVVSTVNWRDVSAQLSVDWSDDSQRKMTTKLTIWGEYGKIFADRQECQVYLAKNAIVPPGYDTGWNVKYTTDVTRPVSFYLRGEEYSSQMEMFFNRVRNGDVRGENDFSSAAETDVALTMMLLDSADARTTEPLPGAIDSGRRVKRRVLGRRK